MKKTYNQLLLLFALCCNVLFTHQASGQSWQWARGVSCNDLANSQSEGYLVKTDLSDNVYVIGDNIGDSMCLGSYKFFNINSLPYGSAAQIIIAKYSSSGSLIWADAGKHGQSLAEAMTVDAGGNLYVFGYFYSDSVRFGTQLLVKSDTFTNHFFLVKYNTTGSALWAKSWACNPGGIINTICPAGLDIDLAGNVFVSGTYKNASISIGTSSVSNTATGYNDIFLAKFDPAGNLKWLKNFGGADDDEVTGMAISKYNKIYLTGAFLSSSISFGSTTLTYTTGSGLANAFLTELDTAGNVIWAKSSNHAAIPYCIHADALNNLYFGGTLMSPHVGFGTIFLDAQYGTFLAKYDTSGAALWAKAFASVTSSPYNDLYSVTTDSCNNIWVTGGMMAGLMLDSIHTLNRPTGSSDAMFIVGLNPGGTLIASQAFTSGGDDNSAITSDSHGNLYLCGDYKTSGFSLGTDTLSHTLFMEQFFVAKYKPYASCNIATLYQNEVTQYTGINLFPNPVTKELTITSQDRITSISINTLVGQTLYTHSYNEERVLIDVGNLPAGIYIIRVNGTDVRKFIKD